jgi:type I restriction enzyme S subunit
MRLFAGEKAPPTWNLLSIESLCTRVTSGGTPSRAISKYYGGGIPWIKTKELADGWIGETEETLTEAGLANSSAKLLPPHTVLMAMYGATVGKLALLLRPMTCNQAACAMVVDDQIADYRYVFYHLLNARAQIMDLANGAAQQNLNAGTIKELQIPLPPLGEQRAIAATVGALDDKIESNERVIDLALQLARSYVNVAVLDRERVPYTDALEVRMGSAFKGSSFSQPGVGRPLMRIRDLKTFESRVWTTEVRKDEVVVNPGNIVVGMDAEFRPTLWLGSESLLNQRVCSFSGASGVGRAFILAALEPELAFYEAAKTGTTVIHLNKADINTFMVPHLTYDEHYRLSEMTERLIDTVVARSQENRTLNALREFLLPELLSGRMRVPVARETVA